MNGDGLVHLMGDDLLDACGTAEPGMLHVAPSTRPARITCTRCRDLLGIHQNPIIVAYREDAKRLPTARDRRQHARDWANMLGRPDPLTRRYYECGASPDEVDRARRILTRIGRR